MPFQRFCLAAVLGLLLTAQVPVSTVEKDLGQLGFPVTTGAAPGYVDERSCALCHSRIAASYPEKGMARAFQSPRPETAIEDFAAPPFVHTPSGQSFQMVRRGDRLVFRRWQTDPEGQPINVFEQEVDWILGSGDHARTYLYRTSGGELYQLPLAWYTQERRWGMAPGFDRPDHDGVLRRVRRECVFCHTSYPDMPAGADAYGAPQVFPARLPEGIGCQRCHGPAAEHVWLAMGGVGVKEEIRASIFNPGRLPPARRDEVCMGCHLQPSVALPGLRRFGRSDFSFRAGEPLSDYLVQVDVEEEGRAPSERFEINHHPYRLHQSRCFLESGGALSCLTCHDPHRRVPEREKAVHYRSACLSCHGQKAHTGDPARREGDCASCHMPKRRTQDVVHVVMTDHLIRRTPGGPELLAPRAETEPVLTGIHLLDRQAVPGALGEVYRAAAVVRMSSTTEALDYLVKMLETTRSAAWEPWLDLAQGQLRRGRFTDAERTLSTLLERRPEDPQVLEWLALVRAGQGRMDEGIAILQRVVAAHSDRAEAEYNLGRLLAARGQPVEAETHLVRALAARPNLPLAWHHLGEVRAALNRMEEALPCWRRALEIDPALTASYLSLGKTLLARGDRAEALRWLRHGVRAAARPDQIAQALREAEEGHKTSRKGGKTAKNRQALRSFDELLPSI
ncbi:MAG TPA: tetratricopeptide repeat protein [Thermoanaerobaculia bacterium]|nr:tetratricopeptide repeat protein [Thermoanaerobaculia bacterium]